MKNITNKNADFIYLDAEPINNAIKDILALSIKHETTASRHEKQVVSMKAGKVKKFLREANAAAKQDRVGVKIDN